MGMRFGSTRAVLALSLGVAVLTAIPSPASATLPAALSTSRVSVANDGAQANGQSLYPSISGDGRYVAFSSSASNLVPGDDSAYTNVFVHDRATGKTEQVDVNSTGEVTRRGSGSRAGV